MTTRLEDMRDREKEVTQVFIMKIGQNLWITNQRMLRKIKGKQTLLSNNSKDVIHVIFRLSFK